MNTSRPAQIAARPVSALRRFAWPALGAGVLLACGPETARACSVCFGDPDSQMAISATRGVLVLLGFIAVVLGSIAAIGGCWIARAHKLHAANRDETAAKSLFLSE